VKHLEAMRSPTLILQGTRDPFGRREEVESYPLSPAIRVAWVEDGDHSFKPRARSGRTEPENLAEAVALAAVFLSQIQG
jgi:predicted alpha/beta-hydrolase family hydrolase